MMPGHRQGLRIAHFVQRYPPALGGSEAYFARLSRYLHSQGDAVTVFTTSAISLEAFWSGRGRCVAPGVQHENGLEIRRYKPCRFPGRRYLLKAVSMLGGQEWKCMTMPCNPISLRMFRDCTRPRPPFDIVHATAFPYAWPIVCALRLARRRRVPFVLTPFLHLGDPEDPRDPTRRAYTTPALMSLVHAADCVFVQTHSEGAELRRLGVPAAKIIEQGLGVDEAECTGGQRRAARQRWRLPPDAVVVGHLANNSMEKGTVDLLCAAEQLWARGVPLHVLLAGPEMANFRRFWKWIDGSSANSQVTRLGVLSEQQKRDFFAAIDIFALPSRTDSFGLVLLEAWANGVPNVVYRAGGPADVVRHDIDGLVVRCGDLDGLSHALARLVPDAALRQRLGLAGKQRLPVDFAWDHKLQLVRNKYLELVRTERINVPRG
jgi:glycosyltransferase involved in cell wall biosynthesis